MSYGDIAEYLGTKGSARTVGYAMNHAYYVSPAVPAHRVVNRNGLLTGKHHFGSPTMMQQLLENEGIIILDDQIQDFEKVRWLPKKREILAALITQKKPTTYVVDFHFYLVGL
jgi:methylated-DNA-protein-cysteine methyltransferase-like protein